MKLEGKCRKEDSAILHLNLKNIHKSRKPWWVCLIPTDKLLVSAPMMGSTSQTMQTETEGKVKTNMNSQLLCCCRSLPWF